jgi:hypothetical protein
VTTSPLPPLHTTRISTKTSLPQSKGGRNQNNNINNKCHYKRNNNDKYNSKKWSELRKKTSKLRVWNPREFGGDDNGI